MRGKSVKLWSDTLRAASVFDGEGRGAPLLLALLLILLPLFGPRALAQNRRKHAPIQTQSEKKEAADELAKTREEFLRSTKEYKESLAQLIALYEKEVRR